MWNFTSKGIAREIHVVSYCKVNKVSPLIKTQQKEKYSCLANHKSQDLRVQWANICKTLEKNLYWYICLKGWTQYLESQTCVCFYSLNKWTRIKLVRLTGGNSLIMKP